MQHITIIAVGKAQSFYAAGVAEYAKRLRPLCHFSLVELAEEPLDEKSASPASIAAALQREGERILAALPKGALSVALCIEGATLSTPAFAALLDNAAQSGQNHVAFVIGSSHGLSPQLKAACTRQLSLSPMTMPHQLARLVLAEQIYRALSIRGGSKYHK